MTGGTSNHFEQEVSLKRITSKTSKTLCRWTNCDLIERAEVLPTAGAVAVAVEGAVGIFRLVVF